MLSAEYFFGDCFCVQKLRSLDEMFLPISANIAPFNLALCVEEPKFDDSASSSYSRLRINQMGSGNAKSARGKN